MLLLPASSFAQHPVGEDAFPWGTRHFFPLRDVNTAEYEPDPSWERLVERRAHTHSGIDFWYGSLSERRLGHEMRVQLNASLTERLRFRYLREEIANEEISVGHERLELQYRIAGPVSLTASGFGALEKSEAAFGVGVLLADSSRTQYLDVTLRNDAVVYDDRTPDDATDPSPPLRVLVEANRQLGRSRAHLFADWGLGHRRVFETVAGSDGVRERRAWTRRAELKLERGISDGLVVGLRYRYSGQMEARELFPGYDDPEFQLVSFQFRRDHHRPSLFVEKHWSSRMRAHATLGLWRETAHADFAVRPGFRLDKRQLLFGGRVLWAIRPAIEIGAGYHGSYLDARRTSTGRVAGGRVQFPAEDRELYADKVHIVATYFWGPTMRFEATLAQEVTRGEFGGGSGKAVILF